MGIVLACCWISLCYILGTKVNSVAEIQDYYGLRVWGRITATPEKKSFFSAVDQWIDSIWRKEKWTVEEQKKYILMNIKMICEKEDIKHIFVTSSIHMSETEQLILNSLADELTQVGIEVTMGEQITCNAQALEQMSKIAKVILVECTDKTKYTALEKELNLCAEQKADVLGVIGLE